jgi:alkanesulfonate monooxygenase SsuD/methylene tetrahydromethanopterin reductase-like flavin-dependent oxidoreductase (luciferase family)
MTDTPKIGLSLESVDPDTNPTDFVRLALTSEAAGFAGVFLPDHVLRLHRAFANPLIALAAIAGATTTISIGTSVLVLPYRQPVVRANQLLTLDAISGGRLIVGAGIGWNESELAATGASPTTRGARADRALLTLRSLMGNDPFTYTDEEFTTTNARPGIAPIRPGGPPLWIGGDGDAAFKRAARFGNAWHAFNATPTQIETARSAPTN